MKQKTVEQKLYDWARWANAIDTGTGYKSIWQSIERNAPHVDTEQVVNIGKVRPSLISDEEAGKIDRAVAYVTKQNAVLGGIIKKRYLRNNTKKEIARYYLTPIEFPNQTSLDWNHPLKKKVATKTVSRLLEAAHFLIESELSRLETKR